jgi:hypothetical protein
MKNILLLGIVFILGLGFVRSQSLQHATISIDKVSVATCKQGDKIIVPVRLIEKSDGLISGFQLFIEFDHTLLTWKGTWENPEAGIIKINEATPYNANDWLFNDNSKQVVGIWIDPSFKGVNIKANEVIFEVVFIYNGGLLSGGTSKLSWGRTLEQMDGKVVRGNTEMFSDSLQYFELELIDGALVN